MLPYQYWSFLYLDLGGYLILVTNLWTLYLVMPLSENFQTKTKPIPTECQFGKPNTKPILYELQKTDICTKFLKS